MHLLEPFGYAIYEYKENNNKIASIIISILGLLTFILCSVMALK